MTVLGDDQQYHAAVIELVGVLAIGELMAFQRTAADAALAPDLADQAALARMADAEYRHFLALAERIEQLGGDPFVVMAPFQASLAEFHAHTAPSDWLEGLVKAYVGDGIATDFYVEIAAYVDPQTRALVEQVCLDLGYAEFVVDRVRAAIIADPKIGGRLALWGRRLVGEALSQAQRVAAEHDGLSSLLVGGVERPGADLAEIGRMLARLTESHTKRMTALGLAA